VKPILTILIFTLLGCTEYPGTSYPPLTVETPSQFSITPTYCLIGDVITISDTGFGTSYRNLRVGFFGDVEVRPDSGNATTAYATVPFGAFSGYVTVTGQAYSDSLPITIYETYHPFSLDARWYNLPDPITAGNVTIVPFWDDTVHWNDWKVTIQGDTVVFDVLYFTDPHAMWHYTLQFQDNGPGSLPGFIGATLTWNPIQAGLLKIQDWNTSGIVSGRIYSYPETGFDGLGFWFDFSAIQPISFEPIHGCIGFEVPTAGTDVIRTDSVYQHYWDNYWAIQDGFGNKTPPPTVDFTQRMVLSVHYGSRDGCFSNVDVIDRIEQVDNVIRVTLARLPYLGECYAVIYPIQMVSIPNSSLDVTFVGEVPR